MNLFIARSAIGMFKSFLASPCYRFLSLGLLTFPDLEETKYWLSSPHERYKEPGFSLLNWLREHLKKQDGKEEKSKEKKERKILPKDHLLSIHYNMWSWNNELLVNS